MPKYKNASGQDLIVPALGGRLVVAGAVVDFPDEAVEGLEGQEVNWLPADEKKSAPEKENS